MSQPGSTFELSRSLSDEEYLALEKKTGQQYELFEGEIFPLPPATYNHRIISANINRLIGKSVRGRFNVGTGDLRLKVEATGLLTYSDLFVTRGDLTMVEPGTTLINPIVLGEVISPSTELYDRTVKFEHYRQISTLSSYLLFSQSAPLVEHYSRETDNIWLYWSAAGPHATIDIPILKATLSLAEIYAGVEFGESFLRPFRH